jgi:hypothetical protein
MLKLKYPSLISHYISYVLFSVIGLVDNLLPAFGKLSFPRAMPFSFWFPPTITDAAAFVGPVPNLDFSALGYDWVIANRTLPWKIGLSFLAFSIYERKFHINFSVHALSGSLTLNLSVSGARSLG